MVNKQNLLYTKFIFLLWLILFVNIKSFSQNRDFFKKTVTSSINASEKIKKADSLIKIYEESNSDSLVNIYSDYAFHLLGLVDIKKIIFYAEKALKPIEEESPSNIYLLQLCTTDLAYYYEKDNQINKAILLYKKAIAYNTGSDRARSCYLQLADIFYDNLKDYYKAKKYYEIVIPLLEKSKQERDLIALRNAYQNFMYTCYFISTRKSLSEGFYYGKKADSLSKIYPPSLENKFRIKLGLAICNTNEEYLNFNIANKYYDETLEIVKTTSNNSFLTITLLHLGDLYETFDEEKSIYYLKKAASLTKNKDTLSTIYYSLGQTYSRYKNYRSSLEYKHKALEYYTGNDFYDIEAWSDSDLTLKKSSIQVSLLINFQQLAQTYLNYYTEKKDRTLLSKSITYFKICDILIDNLKTNSSELKSRLYWRELSTDIYGKAIKACYLNNNLKDAFYFMEKNKALLLLEDIYNKSFKRQAQSELPDHISKQYGELKKDIAIANNQLVNGNKWPRPKIDSLKKRHVDLDIKLSILENEHNITYENLDIETAILSLKDVQNNLKDDEVIVEYHISVDDGYGILTNKDNGYALFISKNHTQLFEINNLSEFKNEVTTLINSFKTPFKTLGDIDKFNFLSNTIYKKLFPTKDIKNLIKDKKLTIVPDTYLSLLPFDALSTSMDSTSYLIRDTEVHYIYSNSFLKNIKSPDTDHSPKSLSIAPVNFNYNNLTSLINSGNEINNIKNYYSGSTLLNEQASKVNFLNALNTTSNGIIHIASHANAQDKITPWIAFNDQKITLEELYLTQNDASLVVLSGCNTSIGKQEIGEGMMSLARGFFYSGSKSVISTLWSIDDRSTSEIFKEFYKNLSKGQTKSRALHSAKKSYLKNHSLPETSPYFWASPILLGQNDILEPSKPKWAFITFGGLFLILLFFFFKRNKK